MAKELILFGTLVERNLVSGLRIEKWDLCELPLIPQEMHC